MTLTGLPYRSVYFFWVRLPDGVRAFISETPKLNRMRLLVRDFLAAGGSRDDIYNRTYYRRVDSMALQSSLPLCEIIEEGFSPRSAVDLGCGTGALLMALQARGVRVFGLDYSRAAIEICRQRGLEVREYDIEADVGLAGLGRFDVAICTEVAEHVKPQFADRLVRQLTVLSDHIIFTAAVPGQGGGVDHVNEQPNSYWIGKFGMHGYAYLEEQTAIRRKWLLDAGVARFYANNLMLFEAQGRLSGSDEGEI